METAAQQTNDQTNDRTNNRTYRSFAHGDSQQRQGIYTLVHSLGRLQRQSQQVGAFQRHERGGDAPLLREPLVRQAASGARRDNEHVAVRYLEGTVFAFGKHVTICLP